MNTKEVSSERLLMQAIAANPRDLQAYCELALSYETSCQLGKAEMTLQRAIELDPLAPRPWRHLGALYGKLQNLRGAVDAFARARELEPHDLKSRIGYAWALMADQDIRAAGSECQSILETFPEQPEAHLMVGHIHNILGRSESAARSYRRAIQADPRRTEALYHLVDLAPPPLSDAVTSTLQAMSADPSLAPREVANANFALARVYEDNGQVAEAMAHYQTANAAAQAAMQKLGMAYDPGRMDLETSQKIEMFGPAAFASQLEPHGLDLKLLFIVGMPRSGTTLVERILSSHPQVSAGGELLFMQHCLTRLLATRQACGRRGSVDVADGADRSLLLELREYYLDRLFERGLDGEYITDKLPANFSAVGLIRVLFPDAHIVHCVRDPVAVSWSLYSAHFGVHLPYNASLDHLVHYHKNVYGRWMHHWSGLLTDDLIEVRYEQLVADSDSEIRRLLAGCGLTWDNACLKFDRDEQPVFTANMKHAREPIFATSVARWKKFAAYLKPLTEQLTADPTRMPASTRLAQKGEERR